MKKFLIPLLLVIVVSVVSFIYIRKRKNNNESEAGADNAPGTDNAQSSSNAALPVASFPLTPYSMAGKYSAEAGSYGQQIASLQKICNEKFGKKLDVDGKFGLESENAFLSCFGFPYRMPYSEPIYEVLVSRYTTD